MRARLGYVTAAALAVALTACDHDPTGTGKTPPSTRPLALCSPFPYSWFAYRNEGGTWKVSIDSSFAIDATDRLTIAVGTLPSWATPTSLGGGSLRVYRLTADQAQALFDCNKPLTPTLSGNDTWTGTISGLRGDTAAEVTAGIANGWIVNASSPRFTLGGTPDTTVDLLAVRVHYLDGPISEPDLMIARPAQRYPDGATLPVLDFDSPEAFPLQRSTLTVSNTPLEMTDGRLNLLEELSTPTGLIVLSAGQLSPVDPNVSPSSASSGIFAVPPARLWAAATYTLALSAFSRDALPPTSEIRATMYFRSPGDRRIAFPPPVSAPAISDAGTSPYRLVRFDVPSQPEYDATIDVSFFDNAGDFFEMYATKEYFDGTPATWSLQIPDLSGVHGFASSWAPQPGPLAWTVAVRNRLDSPWKDGDIDRRATLRGRQQ